MWSDAKPHLANMLLFTYLVFGNEQDTPDKNTYSLRQIHIKLLTKSTISMWDYSRVECLILCPSMLGNLIHSITLHRHFLMGRRTVQSVGCDVQCTVCVVCSVQCVWCAMYSVYCVVFIGQFSEWCVQFAMCSYQCAVWMTSVLFAE